jgi:hypothetical protein
MNIKYCWQNNPSWKNIKLGNCPKATIGSDGCKISCLAYLANIPPDLVNVRFLEAGKYHNGCLISDSNIPSVLPELELANRFPKIAEVVMPAGKGQHFVVALDSRNIIDPWNNFSGVSPYKIKNYRDITLKKGGIMNGRTIYFKTEKPDVYQFKYIPDAKSVVWDNLIKGDSRVWRVNGTTDQLWRIASPKFKEYFKLGNTFVDTLYSSKDYQAACGGSAGLDAKVKLLAGEVAKLTEQLKQEKIANDELIKQYKICCEINDTLTDELKLCQNNLAPDSKLKEALRYIISWIKQLFKKGDK